MPNIITTVMISNEENKITGGMPVLKNAEKFPQLTIYSSFSNFH